MLQSKEQHTHLTTNKIESDIGDLKSVAGHQAEIRRVKKSETVEDTHVRLAAIPSEKGDFVRWRLVSIEVNQHEWYDGFADTQAVKVFPTFKARTASQRHTDIARSRQSWTRISTPTWTS